MEGGECATSRGHGPWFLFRMASGPTNMAMAFPANPPVSLPPGVSSAIALYHAGKAAHAVEQLSAWLSEHAGCAEGWFCKGVMLSDMASIAVDEHRHELRAF